MGYLNTKEHKDWSKKIRESGCVINDNCSKTLSAHHLIPKEFETTRSDPNNGICLCAKHHMRFGYKLSPHSHGSMLFFLWMIKNRPEQLKWVEDRWNEV